jgi:hypothetical protein
MHAEHRFDDVSPSAQADEELAWFFNEASCAIGEPSSHAVLIEGAQHSGTERAERRIEALHTASKIWTRLASLSVTDARVIEALYTERPWPAPIVRHLGPVAGVVAAMATVRAEYMTAWMRHQTHAADVATWLEELLARDSRSLAGWRDEARRTCATAVAAYERARGRGPSVVTKEEL